jgi:hypothetical protein
VCDRLFKHDSYVSGVEVSYLADRWPIPATRALRNQEWDKRPDCGPQK